MISCTRIDEPKVVKHIQETQPSTFGPVKVVYKSMIRAMVNIVPEEDREQLKVAGELDRIYYYDSEGKSLDSLLTSQLDSIIKTETYEELTQIEQDGSTYTAFIKNKENTVGEILFLQSSNDKLMMVCVIGHINMSSLTQNINRLPDLMKYTDKISL
jgi:ribosomal protein L25 (general stress protein Ctc)